MTKDTIIHNHFIQLTEPTEKYHQVKLYQH